jgi:hypothetical protein
LWDDDDDDDDDEAGDDDAMNKRVSSYFRPRPMAFAQFLIN